MTGIETDTTRDVFLGGRLVILQPRVGYRAATDPILLAAAVTAEPGQQVLELGCGAGTALLALGARVPGLVLTGVERQELYADLARQNAAENRIAADIHTADLSHLPADVRRPFDHVLINPPYYPASSPAAAEPGRAQALREETPLAVWVETALKRLKPGGYLTAIHLAERLPELLSAIGPKAGDVQVRPIAPRRARAAGRVLVRARKGSKGPFRLLAPLVMHAGDAHLSDGDDFSPEATAILRAAAPIAWE